MKTPKFIRKIILEAIGGQLPTEAMTPFPRNAFEGFSEVEIDEMVLGSSYQRIEKLRTFILTHIDIAFPWKEQGVALKKIMDDAITKYAREEALSRSARSVYSHSHIEP